MKLNAAEVSFQTARNERKNRAVFYIVFKLMPSTVDQIDQDSPHWTGFS